MSIENLSNEHVLRLYGNIRDQVAADRLHGGPHRLLRDTAKQRANVLRKEIVQRSITPFRISSWMCCATSGEARELRLKL